MTLVAFGLAAVACTDSELASQTPVDATNEDTRPLRDTTDADTEVDQEVTTCTSDAQCPSDGLSPCSTASCDLLSGTCIVSKREDCCETVADCPGNGTACLEYRCPVPGEACVGVDLCAPCQLDSECQGQAPRCTTGRCSEGTCIFEARETCCVEAADCDDADVCTDQTCTLGVCNYRDNFGAGCCTNIPVIATSFDQPPLFAVTSTAADATWSVLSTSFTPTPSAALYVGNASRLSIASDAGTYETEASFSLGAVRANSSIEIKFQAYLDVDPLPEQDRLRVFLRSASGQERVVYNKQQATLGAWHPVKRSLFVEEGGNWTLVFRFAHQAADFEARYFGVLIDDLQVRTGCGAAEGCTSDRECISNDPCVTGTCGGDGLCRFTPRPDCSQCQTPEQCNDGTVCTADQCVNGTCQNTPVQGCCKLDTDCVDNDPCTRELCRAEAGLCSFIRDASLPGCGEGCTNNGQCNDQNGCTTDICRGGVCSNIFDPNLPNCAGCPDPTCDDFDPCTRDFCDGTICRHIATADLPGCSGQCQSDNQCPPPTNCKKSYCDPQLARCVTLDIPDCCSSVSECSDNNACTEDSCAADGRCIHQVIPGCCPGGCNDNDPCTNDRCDAASNRCVFDRIPGCGTPCPNGCDDGNPCTSDVCSAAGQCVSTAIPGCQRCSDGCNDGNLCTCDQCNQATGSCFWQPVPNCSRCTGGCDDQNACTADRCDEASGQCIREPIAGCCTTAGSCDDGNPCTSDQCLQNRCTHTPVQAPGCVPTGCQSDAQCADASACTNNQCIGGTCRTTPIVGCCQNAADCFDGNQCTNDFCISAAGLCVNLQTGCDDNNACTIDACDPQAGCTHAPDPNCACSPSVLWKRSFVAGESADITTDGGGFGVRWRVDGIRSFSPSQSIRYGDEGGEDYDIGFRTAGRATGPTLSVPASAVAARLDFMVYVDVDPDVDRDSLRARVLYGNNQNVVVWDRISLPATQFKQWVPVSVPLPSAVLGRDIQIRFVFDSIDGQGNKGQGVFVDDITVYTTCQ
ncbi:MAG: hypothetical protein JNJ59_04990 [Deltaproteobacteria bacterium]|nr:hypothetical protein [Deltaproteobacteria bacterium]